MILHEFLSTCLRLLCRSICARIVLSEVLQIPTAFEFHDKRLSDFYLPLELFSFCLFIGQTKQMSPSKYSFRPVALIKDHQELPSATTGVVRNIDNGISVFDDA
ncbi:hypothetical protein Hsc_3374 [Herbaspirillum seropedicae]|nr:hypothetical protein Hsc_3374 [Herbaspirillum seropedicae]